MKFEQALKAMRRGEKVRCRCWDRGVCMWMRDGRIDASRAEKPGFTQDANLIRDDWVIVRKKKKPRFSEDELEPVGTMPVVGDKFIALYCRHDQRGVDVVAEVCGGSVHGERERHWSDSCFAREAPDGAVHRILRRPAKPLRDVFADPRVGDVIETKSGSDQYTVVGVDDRSVTFACGAVGKQSREQWAAPRNAYTIISRVPEEVAPS